jgi:hypothetical protein
VGVIIKVAACAAFFAAIACGNGRPARLVAGNADTVVVNGLKPEQLPMQVLDRSGNALPDTGVRYEWTSGLPITVTARGAVTCAQAGDATVRASLGTLATPILIRCRPVHEIRVLGVALNMFVGDPPQDLVVEAIDSAGRRVTEVAARVRYDSTVVALEHWRLRPRAPGWAAVEISIGDQWAFYPVHVFERASTVDGIRPGQHLAVPVRLAAGEMRSWELPPSPPNYDFQLLPDPRTAPTGRLAVLGANCQRSSDPLSRWCFALPGASVVVYSLRQNHSAQLWSGTLTVFREPCPRSPQNRPRTGVCAAGPRPS